MHDGLIKMRGTLTTLLYWTLERNELLYSGTVFAFRPIINRISEPVNPRCHVHSAIGVISFYNHNDKS